MPESLKPSQKIENLMQREILATLRGLPPLELYANVSKTGMDNLQTVREHFEDIGHALAAYFGGSETSFGTDRKRKRLIEQEVKYYLAFYDLVWFGWEEIKTEVSKSLAGQQFPEQPGKALLLLFELECLAMSTPSTEGSYVNVRESRRLLKEGIPDIEIYSGTDKKRAERTKTYAKEVLERSGCGAYIGFCQNAVKKRLRGNPVLRSVLKGFEAEQKNRFKTLAVLLNGVHGK